MAQHVFLPPSLLARIYKVIAELLTPDAHIPSRWEIKNKFLRKAGLKIGGSVAIDNKFDWLMGVDLTINDYAAIGKNVRIYNFSEVTIGKFAMFAGDVLIVNGGHDKNTFTPFSGSIIIGSGVWIGAGAKIVGANLMVGDNAIVGAGSLVIRDVPSCAIVAGVPAKVIGYRTLPEKVWHLGNTWFSPYTFELVENSED